MHRELQKPCPLASHGNWFEHGWTVEHRVPVLVLRGCLKKIQKVWCVGYLVQCRYILGLISPSPYSHIVLHYFSCINVHNIIHINLQLFPCVAASCHPRHLRGVSVGAVSRPEKSGCGAEANAAVGWTQNGWFCQWPWQQMGFRQKCGLAKQDTFGAVSRAAVWSAFCPAAGYETRLFWPSMRRFTWQELMRIARRCHRGLRRGWGPDWILQRNAFSSFPLCSKPMVSEILS